jgi:hypothetical protein
VLRLRQRACEGPESWGFQKIDCIVHKAFNSIQTFSLEPKTDHPHFGNAPLAAEVYRVNEKGIKRVIAKDGLLALHGIRYPLRTIGPVQIAKGR